MKKDVFILMFVIVFLFSISLIISDFTQGEKLYHLDLIYGPSQPITGWVNISLEDEPTNSLLTGFDSSIELKDFLDETDASYSCSPNDCESNYASSGIGLSSKKFTLNGLDYEVLGVRLTGQVTGVNSLSFEIATNAGKSCIHPMQIDVLDDGMDNGVIDWKAEIVSDDFSCILSNNHGCWDESDYSSGQEFLITDSQYCEKINLLAPAKNFEIGGEVIEVSGGEVDFKIEINAGINSGECIVTTSSAGEISCNVEFDDALEENVESEVCISVDNSDDNGKYQIKYEDVSPCGSAGSQEYDFPIFVNPGKYDAVSDFTFNQNLINDGNTGINLADEIWYYINDKYNGDCEPECIVPLKFYSGVSQTNTISNLNLIYEKGGSLSETKIYNVVETPALINADFQKLSLIEGDFLTPDNYGNEEFILELNGDEIFSEDIEIKQVPEINSISPNIIPALVEVEFSVMLEDSGINLTYSWDFGDGSGKETSETNTIKHSYPDIGSYDMIVKVSNDYGESSKTFQINVISPEEAIGTTLTEYEEDLASLEIDLNNLPVWIKTEIQGKFDLDNLKSSVNLQKKKYEEASGDEDYVEIMASLLNLKIPYKLDTSQIINPLTFFPNKEQLNLEVLENFGAGKPDESEDKYHNAVNNWIQENLDIFLESKTYSFYYRNSKIEQLVSYFKIVLIPKQDLEEVYLIVNGNPEKINFKDTDTKESGSISEAVIFPELIETKTIEFLYPEGVDIDNLPVYISPELKYLNTGIIAGVCNSNKKCEKALGEDYKNCRTDCKPLGWTVFLLLGVLFGAFIVYIVLQEWYKRHYESKLFKNKNQLFNLINFMDNSLNQGIKKSEIFSKLKPLGWISEQLNYSWKKLHGKRTGMWEIPVFKWIEKKKVKEELAKRTNKPSVAGLNLK